MSNTSEDPWANTAPKHVVTVNIDDPWATEHKFFLIVVENIDETQRRLIQALVKRKSASWWHEMLDVWIVQGGGISQWVNDLNIIITGSEHDQCMVLALPDPKKERALGMVLPAAAKQWLIEVYSKGGTLKVQTPAKVAGKKTSSFDDEPPF
jgi:hypothetical protein